MRILLDECVPRRLLHDLPGDVSTVPQIGFTGLSNGSLLSATATDFDVFLTLDQNLQFQQNLTDFAIAVLVVCASSSRYEDVHTFLPQILSALETIGPQELVVLSR